MDRGELSLSPALKLIGRFNRTANIETMYISVEAGAYERHEAARRSV